MIAGRAGSHPFTVGEFECVALSDGNVVRPPGHLFANAPKAQIEETLHRRNLPTDYVTMPNTHVSVNTGEHCVLVDMGAGSLAPGAGRLPENLRAAGIEPAEISLVIITHAHPAQVGGMFDDQDEPVYANARYCLWKDEWGFWASEVAFAKAPERHVVIARRNLEPIRDRLTLLDGEGEIVPGIRAVPAPGHTPGHIVVTVSSGGERLFYTGDTALHPLHLEHPDWTPIYDIAPRKAAVSKRVVFDLAAEETALVMGHHFCPFPSLGNVVKRGRGWQWQPTEGQRMSRQGH